MRVGKYYTRVHFNLETNYNLQQLMRFSQPKAFENFHAGELIIFFYTALCISWRIGVLVLSSKT